MAETIKDIISQVGGADYSVPFIINGQEVHPKTSFDVTSPSTGKVVHKCGSGSEAEALAAVEAAASAFKTWKNTLPKQRRDIFLKAAEIMEKRKEEIKSYMSAETGCGPDWGEFNVMTARDCLIDVAGRIATLEGTIPTTQDPNVGALVLQEPYGAILAIAPW
jgi:acyl-CoA reductase-like NAD-dependent aldehyde dehydrogenase